MEEPHIPSSRPRNAKRAYLVVVSIILAMSIFSCCWNYFPGRFLFWAALWPVHPTLSLVDKYTGLFDHDMAYLLAAMTFNKPFLFAVAFPYYSILLLPALIWIWSRHIAWLGVQAVFLLGHLAGLTWWLIHIYSMASLYK